MTVDSSVTVCNTTVVEGGEFEGETITVEDIMVVWVWVWVIASVIVFVTTVAGEVAVDVLPPSTATTEYD